MNGSTRPPMGNERLRLNFVRQQGFRDATSGSCGLQYPALMWQPRVIGVLVVIGLVLQSWRYFLVMSAILWWNVFLPHLNLFEAAYNLLVAKPKGLPRAPRAPAPRRFAQATAGTFMLVIAVSLARGWNALAVGVEVALVFALAALIFGRFCLGSYLFHVLTGNGGFANRTLPWSRDEMASGPGADVVPPGAPSAGS